MEPISLILILATVFNLLLGSFILLQKPRALANFAYAIIVFFVALWSFSLFMDGISFTKNSLFFWIKLTYLSGFLTSPAFLYFSFVFPRPMIELTKSRKFLILTQSIIIFIFLYFSNYIIKDVYFTPDSYGIVYGSLYFLYVLFFILTFGLGYYNLTKSYFRVSGIEKKQLSYVIVGTSISAFFGVIFDLVFPFFW